MHLARERLLDARRHELVLVMGCLACWGRRVVGERFATLRLLRLQTARQYRTHVLGVAGIVWLGSWPESNQTVSPDSAWQLLETLKGSRHT